MPKKYFLITYGCQMNKSDSERIAAVLENNGYKNIPKIERADLIVVNMCSVRQSAVDRVYGKTLRFAELKTQNSKFKTILTGCILNKDKLKFAKKFDLILDIKDLPNWPRFLTSKTTVISRSWPLFYEGCYLDIRPKYQNNFSALVPISNGCNNFCTFCVVPFTRGPLIFRPRKEIITEVKSLIKRGYKEIWLLGQNVNSYKDSEINFAKLLKTVNDIPGNFWIRFTSSHPKPSTRAKLGAGLVPHRPAPEKSRYGAGAGDFSWDELIETIARCKKVTEYLNLPVQSGDNQILKKMNRPYTVKHYKNLVKKIRQKIPEISLSTDVIVGFPGEREKQFQNTLNLFKEIGYDMAYISRYSPRPGTAAAKMKDDVSWREKEKRLRILTEILKKTALLKNKRYVGKTTEVLAEDFKNGFLIAKNRGFKTVKFEGEKNLVGQFLKVKIIDALAWGLKGEAVKDKGK